MHGIVLGFLISAAVRMVLFAGLIYFTFFVSLGEHTLYGHATRIAGTSEAQELWHEVGAAGERTAQGARALLADQASLADGAKKPSDPTASR